MLLAEVLGHATATLKHRSLRGLKTILAQPVRSLTVEPLLVVDRLGAAPGDLVLITGDGAQGREIAGDKTSPIRWTVLGIVEPREDGPTA